MTSYYSPELVTAIHRDLLDRGAHYRRVADARRHQKARRLSRKADQLAKRAADLVAGLHR